MAYLFKPFATKPVPAKASIATVRGKKVAKWTARGGKEIVAELNADGTKCRVTSPTWWIEYTDAQGVRQKAKGFRDRKATLQLAARLENKAEAIKAGKEIEDEAAGHVHMIDHIPAYREYLTQKGVTKVHLYEAVEYVRQILTAAGLATPAAVNCEQLDRWLDLERKSRDRRAAEWKPESGEPKPRGWSQRTLNHRITKLRAFGSWLVKTRRARWNPFTGLTRANPEQGRRHVRRALDPDDLARIVAAARTSAELVCGMTGPDRAMLYLVAAYTGFRRRALANLTPESVQWAEGVPVAVSATARATKNKKPHTVPLHPEVGQELAAWLADRPAGRVLWGDGEEAGWKTWDGAEMIRHDMAAARAAWIDEVKDNPKERVRRERSHTLLYRDAAGEVFDFHSLRVQFISGLATSGVPLTAAQKLADHSDPRLTSNIYTKWGGRELSAEVAKLPSLTRGAKAGKSPTIPPEPAQGGAGT